jgi:hypothetical protein
MSIDDFVRYSKVLHGLSADFVRAVPEDKWDFTPDPPGKSGRTPTPHRIGDGFAPFCKQLRHVVCVRGVYNAALAMKKVDWTRKHEHYVGPLTREALLAALDEKQRRLVATLEAVDIDAPIDGTERLSPLPSLRGSSCNTRRSITVTGASMPHSPASKRRSAGARHGACEDRHAVEVRRRTI